MHHPRPKSKFSSPQAPLPVRVSSRGVTEESGTRNEVATHETPNDISPVSLNDLKAPSSKFSSMQISLAESKSLFSEDQDERKSPNLTNTQALIEKALVEASDFSGLQVDDRPKAHKDLPPLPPPYQEGSQHHIVDEKKRQFAAANPHPLYWPKHANVPSEPHRSQPVSNLVPDSAMKEVVLERIPDNEEKRIPGSEESGVSKRMKWARRRRLWLLGGIIALLIIVAVIVGAVVGTQKRSQEVLAASPSSSGSPNGSPVQTPTAAPSAINANLPSKDLQVDTPLVPIAFVANTSNAKQNPSASSSEIWYQNKCGNVKGVQNYGSWAPYGTAFTDSASVAGMAGVTFFNQTTESYQTYLFYTSVDGKIRDKKLNPQTNTFDIGSLAPKHISISPSPSNALMDNSSNPWDGYAMAAVYSSNFPLGPGIRLFYHASNQSGNYLQELVWTEKDDTWWFGATIGDDVLPVSKLAMAVDEQNGVVRLMYAAQEDGRLSLQEWYMMLTPIESGGAVWKRGQNYGGGYLQHPSSSIAMAASGGSVYLYRVVPFDTSSSSSSSNSQSSSSSGTQLVPQLQIQELTLPEANTSMPIDTSFVETVAVPDWLAADTGNRTASLYTPFTAIGSPGRVTVYYAEGVEDALAGYDRLVTVSRELGKSWGPAQYASATGQVTVPVDSKCSKPQI